jgi:7,8-dihydropterin-6-yl-methyl-4-(beta-D-ribofuranosyl)aminobenzene 5'-phosphate synthase
MKLKITTLVDNTVAMGGNKLIGEHGLSFYLETPRRKILFDTGQNLALSHNAGVLGIDLRRVDTVVLSHGHYDHTGGLKNLLTLNTTFTLFAHPGVLGRKLRFADKKYKDIGIPVDRTALETSGVTLKLNQNPAKIAAGIMTSGEIPLTTDFETVESGFFIERENTFSPDTLADDQALILETEKGLVVLLGCSHRGVINTLNHVLKVSGKDSIYAVIGGLHLGKASNEKLKKISDHLHKFNIEKIGLAHCTGTKALLAFSSEFGSTVFLNAVGNVLAF